MSPSGGGGTRLWVDGGCECGGVELAAKTPLKKPPVLP
ncbi:hypothetical protein E2C01_082192 [Portunus trituberculatus]|uniref:Uncharacterized protein n=1 Tax=Portunus trituberculatus TaxID=210409 RepID=A0A5B7ITV9_PORTR|nr:hypothetical protein [Portunus trituberculatus]